MCADRKSDRDFDQVSVTDIIRKILKKKEDRNIN